MESLCLQVQSCVPVHASERGRAGAAGGRHGLRDGEVRRRVVRRDVRANQGVRNLPWKLRATIMVRKSVLLWLIYIDGDGLGFGFQT